MKSSSILQVQQLSKRFGNEMAIHSLDFSLDKNKCIALIGPNGAGKTTILRMLAGLLQPTSGKIVYTNLNTTTDFRHHVGYLPQYPAMYAWMTSYEFLLYCAKLSYIPVKIAQERATQLLDKVGIAEAKDKKIHSLSGGMKQRLGIAQALIHQPELLLLDEPVSALDPLGRREVLTLMEELKKETTILFSTHILADADEISDELLLLHEGKLVESGTMIALRNKYQTATIEVSFRDELENYEEKIRQIDGVLTTHIQRNKIHLAVTDIEKVQKVILQNTITEKWPLIHFSINQASLEDMFMKAVNA